MDPLTAGDPGVAFGDAGAVGRDATAEGDTDRGGTSRVTSDTEVGAASGEPGAAIIVGERTPFAGVVSSGDGPAAADWEGEADDGKEEAEEDEDGVPSMAK